MSNERLHHIDDDVKPRSYAELSRRLRHIGARVMVREDDEPLDRAIEVDLGARRAFRGLSMRLHEP